MNNRSTHSDVLVLSDFLSPNVCAKLRAEIDLCNSVPAGVAKTESRVDVEMRRSNRVLVSEPTQKQVCELLEQVKPQLCAHFETELTGFERPQFLLYKPGDFYRKHTDNTTRPDAPHYIKARRVSIVIFLNDERNDLTRGSYAGGSLIIYGASPDLRSKIRGETGTLVAFHSQLRHEVETVESGQRYSIVNWFF